MPFSNSRAPPPTSGPRSARLVGRVYSGDLRPTVIFMAVIGAVWALVWTVGSFEDIGTDKKFGSPKLGVVDIVLGAIYAATAGIEFFGAGAALMRRVSLMKLYTLLSMVGVGLVVGAQILLFVLHFVFKGDLINECEQLSQNATLVERIGIWGPIVTDQLDASQIADACHSLWSRDSLTSFVWIVVVTLYALFTVAVAFAYVHQLRDPTSVINSSRAPSNQVRTGFTSANTYPYPSHYNPPYAAPNLPYGAGPYAPPAGPPPGASDVNVAGYNGYDGAKAPMYEGGAPGYGAEKADDPFADFESRPAGRRGSDETLTESAVRAGGSKFDV